MTEIMPNGRKIYEQGERIAVLEENSRHVDDDIAEIKKDIAIIKSNSAQTKQEICEMRKDLEANRLREDENNKLIKEMLDRFSKFKHPWVILGTIAAFFMALGAGILKIFAAIPLFKVL